MKILITGGAGFLGSHLCERLLNEGHKVICMDNFFTGSKSNVSHLLNDSSFELLEQDVTRPFHLWPDIEVHQIYNLACPASPVHYQFDPIKTTQTSVIGALNCLSLADLLGARIFQASTSEVYGDPSIHPQPESYWGNVNPIGVRSCYDEGKRCAESLFFDYHRQHGVDIRVARIFNTYGPNMASEDGRVVSNFIVQALNGQDITVYGEGQQTRSFCYVDDLIEGFVRLMNQDRASGPINLGNPREFTVLELAEKVIKLTESSSNIVYKPMPKDDPKQRQPDITPAKAILDWEPKIDLEHGLERTINYFKSRILLDKVFCR
jgi:UDP-glucuronate decarboxylase